MTFGKGNFIDIPKEKLVEWAKLGGETSHIRREENKKLYYLNPKRCKQCGEIIPYEKKRTSTFCNHTCAAIYNNPKRLKTTFGTDYNTSGDQSYDVECKYCGKILKRRGKRKQNQNFFCCVEHQHFYYTEQKIKSGQHVKPSTLRNYLIHKRGYKCEECKLTEWMGKPIPLDTHHKDGDSTNNDQENLKLLCKNCHGQTDNYGAKNIGKGTRKSYYKKKE